MINEVPPIRLPTAGRPNRLRLPVMTDSGTLIETGKIARSRLFGRILGRASFSVILGVKPADTFLPGFFSSVVWTNPIDTVIDPNGAVSQDVFSGSVINAAASCTLSGVGQPTIMTNIGVVTCPSAAANCAVKMTPGGLAGNNFYTLMACDETFTDFWLDQGWTTTSIALTAGLQEFTFTKPDGITTFNLGFTFQSASGFTAEAASLAAQLSYGVV